MASLYPLTTRGKLKFMYNTLSLILWWCCFIRFLILLPLVGIRFIPGGIADFFHTVAVTPTIGILAIPNWSKYRLWYVLNSIRMIWMCYGVIFPHPKIAKHASYSFLLTAWCLEHMINFAFYAFKSKTRTSPQWLFWMKYHKFYLTLPATIIPEMILIFLSLMFVEDDSIYEWFLKSVFIAYIPISYFNWKYLKWRKTVKYSATMERRKQRAQNIKLQTINSPSVEGTSSNPQKGI